MRHIYRVYSFLGVEHVEVNHGGTEDTEDAQRNTGFQI
jgi:hypothetical protein